MSAVRILLWNTEWARSETHRGTEIRRRIEEVAPDVVCITEGYADLLPRQGHRIESGADYGYPIQEGRRKVLLWSRAPWSEVDRVGHPEMPGGRFVSGVTQTPVGALEFFGVCIPWRDAHVRTGRRDRGAWEDHRKYLRGLGSVLRRRNVKGPAVILGDFNQRVPRFGSPEAVYQEMAKTFEPAFSICTGGQLERADGLTIDHVAHTGGLRCIERWAIPKVTDAGLRLSDHFGLVVSLGDGAG